MANIFSKFFTRLLDRLLIKYEFNTSILFKIMKRFNLVPDNCAHLNIAIIYPQQVIYFIGDFKFTING